MKKLLSILVVLALGVGISFAQSTSAAVTMTTVGSPVINTASATCSLKVTDTYKQVTIQTVITKVSGTVAGTVTLQGSLDGVNYVTIPTAGVIGAAFTFTATYVGTQSVSFIVNYCP